MTRALRENSIHLGAVSQLSVPGRPEHKSGSDVGGPADAGGAHKGHSRAVRALLRDGQHLPALQDLRRARQGRQNRALRALALHALSHRLAGSSHFSILDSSN